MVARKQRRRRLETAVAIALAATTVVIAASRSHDKGLGYKHLILVKVGRFDQPDYVAQPPGERDQLYVVGRHGVVWVLKGGRRQAQPFLDIRDQVKSSGTEQGLLSIAFPPDYATSGLFYVAYTGHSGDLRIVEYRRSAANGLLADASSARSVLRIRENSSKHHSGQLQFGPDGYLYIGSGDGGPSYDPYNTAQSRATLLGKILRIDPRRHGRHPYTVPRGNPFVGRRGRNQIYAYGFRNPWRFSFDRATGALAIGDVGQDRFEEVDILPAGQAKGKNFGWSAYEGFATFKGGVPRRATVMPTLAYPHGPGCAVVGGYFVRDQQLAHIKGRELLGHYLFGDFCTGGLRAFSPNLGTGKPGRDHGLGLKVAGLDSFGEDDAGHIYVVSERGPVYRIVATRKR